MTEPQKTLSDWIVFESKNPDYDCPEAMLAACNEYYQLGLDEQAIQLMAGFGEGMFSHKTCGALIGATAALSALMARSASKGKAVEFDQAVPLLQARFQQANGLESLDCREIQPLNWAGEDRFVRTDLNAAKALEQTIEELGLLV